jgi:hypothetical protein
VPFTQIDTHLRRQHPAMPEFTFFLEYLQQSGRAAHVTQQQIGAIKAKLATASVTQM